jgi:hypothetical protein
MVERLSSSSKNIVNEKRTSLDCEKINQLLFLQKNLKRLKQLVNDKNRKQTISTSSTNTISSEESFCTIPKQQRLNSDDHCSDSTDVDIFLD